MEGINQERMGREVIQFSLQTKEIENKIYTLRGVQVMLDYDLAALYGYEVKRLNEQVKRNIERFPDDFMFQLNRDEIEVVKSQIATSRNFGFFSGHEGGRRKPPYAFIEQGIYMLATGASIKDAGRKCFGVSLLEEPKMVEDLLKRLHDVDE